jgi:hypothetical protein
LSLGKLEKGISGVFLMIFLKFSLRYPQVFTRHPQIPPSFTSKVVPNISLMLTNVLLLKQIASPPGLIYFNVPPQTSPINFRNRRKWREIPRSFHRLTRNMMKTSTKSLTFQHIQKILLANSPSTFRVPINLCVFARLALRRRIFSIKKFPSRSSPPSNDVCVNVRRSECGPTLFIGFQTFIIYSASNETGKVWNCECICDGSR